MTREEAVERLKSIKSLVDKYDDVVALREAVKALEQEPCEDTIGIPKDALKWRGKNMVAYNVEWLREHWQEEMNIVCGVKPCGDAISRQAVEEIINDIRDCISVEGYCAILERLKKLPSVNPQPKTGHWIRRTDTSGNSWHTCPTCGHIVHTLTRFCPDCGARLEAPS